MSAKQPCREFCDRGLISSSSTPLHFGRILHKPNSSCLQLGCLCGRVSFTQDAYSWQNWAPKVQPRNLLKAVNIHIKFEDPVDRQIFLCSVSLNVCIPFYVLSLSAFPLLFLSSNCKCHYFFQQLLLKKIGRVALPEFEPSSSTCQLCDFHNIT